jgi:hypothetical protein
MQASDRWQGIIVTVRAKDFVRLFNLLVIGVGCSQIHVQCSFLYWIWNLELVVIGTCIFAS